LVCFILSLPARSITLSFDFFTIIRSSSMVSDWMKMVKMTCDLELYVFMVVIAIFLEFSPSIIS
jgi:hypothetical protein